MTSDEAHIRFMTAPGAHLIVRVGGDARGESEVLLHGNRSGILSLANVLLWLHAVAWRRELLSLGELPFVTALYERGAAVFSRTTSTSCSINSARHSR